MSIYNTARAVLDTKLASVSGLPDVAWENVPYKTDPTVAFLKPTVSPSSRRPS